MTPKQLRRLKKALVDIAVEDILSLSDEEALAELAAEGLNPDQILQGDEGFVRSGVVEKDNLALMLMDFSHPEGIESGEAFLERTKWIFEQPYQSKFGAMWLDQLDAPGPEHSFLIDGWLSTGDKSILAGPRGSGKSFLAIEIGMRLAHGQPLFGLPIRHAGGVVYQAGEGQQGVKKRLRAWRDYHGIQFYRETPFVLLTAAINIYRDDPKELIEEINSIGKTMTVPLRLIVIDTWATATVGAGENDIKDVSVALENVDKINRQCAAHVMLVHHMNASGLRERGHTSIGANMDQMIFVKRDPFTKIRTAALEKQKDEEDGGEVSFELIQVKLGIDEDGREITSCVCAPMGQRDVVRREEEMKGMRLTPRAELFMKAFFAAEARYGVPVPDEWSVPYGVRAVVPWSDVKRIHVEMNPSDEIEEDSGLDDEAAKARDAKFRETTKKRIVVLREELMSSGVLEFRPFPNHMPRSRNQMRDSLCYYTGKPLRAFPHTQQLKSPGEEPGMDIPF